MAPTFPAAQPSPQDQAIAGRFGKGGEVKAE
jgi:hypothetical protein